MKLSDAKLYLHLVQAAAEGKTIQRKEFGDWIDVTDAEFSLTIDRYRIKPEPPKPREFCLRLCPNNPIEKDRVQISMVEIAWAACAREGCEQIKVREVL